MLFKHKSKRVSAISSVFKKVDSTEKFHPLSYYLLGGVDLSGRELDKSTEVDYDTPEDVEKITDAGFSSVAVSDPRVSIFDLVEHAGVKAAQELIAEKPNPFKNSDE